MNYTKKRVLRVLLIVATLVIGIILGLWQVRPPALPHKSTAEYLIYQNMMENIQKLAAEPHPSGSIEIEVVRAEIIAEIESMGLKPDIQDAGYMLWNPDSESLLLQNILVKLDAPGTDRGVMFVSHYDSVPDSPGAADAMLPVCAMLEALRVHAQNGVLQTNIYFLFTDGEEMGLLGARRFVEDNPELKDKIDMVINLEMRGNRGGVLLFEASPGAYSMLRTVKQSGAKTIGISWAVEVYAMMPNNTDLTAFFDAGYNGINYAAIEGVEHYHTPTDNFENLDRSTSWHYLQIVLALADHAANNDLSRLHQSSPEAVYFPFLPGVLVLMTAFVSHILCAAACVLFLVFTIVKMRNKELKVSFRYVLLCLLFLLSILSAVFFAAGSYLFYIPLMVMSISALLTKWPVAHLTARILSGIAVLLIWVPVVFLLWVSMVQPMLL
jgi:hypothetical protein